jgi:hypothetical protein
MHSITPRVRSKPRPSKAIPGGPAAWIGGEPHSIVRLSDSAGVSRRALIEHVCGLVCTSLAARVWLHTIRPGRGETTAETQRSLELISKRWDESLQRLVSAMKRA